MLALAKTVRAREARIEALETEHRNYTSIVTQALVDSAADTVADAYTSAMETAAAQLARAFAAAVVTGPGARAFSPWVMAQIGRSLVECGESVWFRVGQRLVRGDNYELDATMANYTFSLPSGIVNQQSSRVVHVRWNVNIDTGRGVGPLGTARALRTLMQRLEGSLGAELSAAVGYLLPLPTDGDASVVEAFKQDIASLRGKIAVVETSRGGWGQGPGQAPRREYELSRLGPNIPDSSVRLFREAREAVLTACGMPVSLLGGDEGTSQREAWRRYLHGTVAPLGRFVVVAAAAAGLRIELDWSQLFASDIAGRARAFQGLVNGGMSLEDAAAASGILRPEDS